MSEVRAGGVRSSPAGDLYAACLRLAAWLEARRLRVALIGAPLVVAALAAIHWGVLLGFPNSGDEYVYLLQARVLSAGRLWWPASPAADLFVTNYVATEASRTFGTFPPGWPLALALAIHAGVPAWLVNPILGVATLALVWTLGHQLYGPRIGVLAALLVLVSPFFLFTAASYFSHPLCSALVLAAACLAARDDRRPWWVAMLVGMLLGWAIVSRYFTGVVCAVPVAWWLVRPGVSRPRTLALVAIGGLPWALALLGYDAAISTRAWHLTTTELTYSRWFAPGVQWRGADILASHLVRHLLWTPPVLVVAYAIYLRTAPADAKRGLFGWLPLLMAVGLYAYSERGGNQYGARFHYEVFPFLVIFVTAQIFRVADGTGRSVLEQRLFRLLVASVAMMPVAFVVHAVVEHAVIRERMHPFVLASSLGLDGALVLIDGRVGTRRSMSAADLTRNAPALDDPVIFGVDPGAERRCAAVAQLPDRVPYLYHWDTVAGRGALTPLLCS